MMKLYLITAYDECGTDLSQFIAARTADEAVTIYKGGTACCGDTVPPYFHLYALPDPSTFKIPCVIGWDEMLTAED